MYVNVLAYSRAAWTIFEVLSKVVRAARGTWARERTTSLTTQGTCKVEAHLPLPALTPPAPQTGAP